MDDRCRFWALSAHLQMLGFATSFGPTRLSGETGGLENRCTELLSYDTSAIYTRLHVVGTFQWTPLYCTMNVLLVHLSFFAPESFNSS